MLPKDWSSRHLETVIEAHYLKLETQNNKRQVCGIVYHYTRAPHEIITINIAIASSCKLQLGLNPTAYVDSCGRSFAATKRLRCVDQVQPR